MYMDNYYILAGIFATVLILINKFRYREVKDYQEYLKSKHWKRTRENALTRYGYKCMICSRKDNLNVHHNTYNRISLVLFLLFFSNVYSLNILDSLLLLYI